MQVRERPSSRRNAAPPLLPVLLRSWPPSLLARVRRRTFLRHKRVLPSFWLLLPALLGAARAEAIQWRTASGSSATTEQASKAPVICVLLLFVLYASFF